MFIILFHLFAIILTLYSKFQVAVNSISAKNRTRVHELFFLPHRPSKLSPAVMSTINGSYVYRQYTEMAVTCVTSHSPHTSVLVHVILLFI